MIVAPKHMKIRPTPLRRMVPERETKEQIIARLIAWHADKFEAARGSRLVMITKLIFAAAVISIAATTAHAENYIKMPSGYITPKHECSASDVVCVDCTFLSDKACYEQADKAGLIDKNIGFGPGQRPPA
jgi:hypothetical protein